jgi:dihydrofolate synthase/folylpolyglutamate synthase
MSDASLAQWLQRLETLHPRAVELGLARVATVADALYLRPFPADVVTVAGTNGKGSTCAALEALLRTLGRHTGCFTSPHLLRFNERIRVGGIEVADGEITRAFQLIDDARGDTSLTYFEFATLAALLVFRARAVDTCILEVGLGGRLDSVNIIDADVAVITSIDLDHQEWLGESLDDIGREKAGILRPGKPAVIADEQPPAGLLQAVADTGAQPVYYHGVDFAPRQEPGAGSWQPQITEAGRQRLLPAQASGSLLPVNLCAAVQAVVALGLRPSDRQVTEALRGLEPPAGRRQLLHIAGRHYLLDVAHNPAAVDRMLEYIKTTGCYRRKIAVFSVMADKDVAGILDRAAPGIDAWFLGEQPDNPRAQAAAQTADLLRARGQGMISVSKNLKQAFRRAQSLLAEGDLLVVFGSFFTVAAVLPQLDRDRGKATA